MILSISPPPLSHSLSPNKNLCKHGLHDVSVSPAVEFLGLNLPAKVQLALDHNRLDKQKNNPQHMYTHINKLKMIH